MGLDEVVERVFIEDAIQPLVERVSAVDGKSLVAIHNPRVRPRSLRRPMAMHEVWYGGSILSIPL